MLIDGFNRVHNYLRISLTDNCNFRCFYCMPNEDHLVSPPEKLMQLQEIENLARVFVTLGVTKIRLTGGEPLVRKDAAIIIKTLSKLPVKLTLTTNGYRLQEFLPVLQEAGITSLNISLDTLQPHTFERITRRNSFAKVMQNIRLMMENNFYVKINVVVMAGMNDKEVIDFVEWTRNEPVHVRFIEFMPFKGNHWVSNKVFTWQQILQSVSKKYEFLPLKNNENDTAKAYMVPGHQGTFAVISTMSAPFCSTCNRMRLTADGKLKNCLFAEKETDLLTALRNGEDIAPLIKQNINTKAKELGGQFTKDFEGLVNDNIHNRSMITIGG